MSFFSELFNNTFKFNYVTGLFLLILSISGNFIAETLSCQMQKILTHNMIVKQLMILFMIYFTIDFTTSENVYPLHQLKGAFGIWLFFLMFTKMNIYFTITAFILLALLYVCKNFENYWKKKKNEKKLKYIVDKSKIIEKLMILTVLIGFISYFIKQHNDHKNFSFLKFILGKEHCDHNK